ncbi:hypothetical protein AAFF_G00064870 [Aldrovandia affinis]|uniref:Uncharacterized protein n=1 Tax=Aldrovandia affinis TaxID=143900 RepID=A0AAD7T3Q8_9TELE|nr:hypothetical protein AAFF_G00064870 [Aldrovandia affinis]
MERANNAIRLWKIQGAVIEDEDIVQNIDSVSLSTVDSVLKRNQVHLKQLYKVLFDRNGMGVKELRYQYVQIVMELEANKTPRVFVYVDEAGFNLAKVRKRDRNII